MRIAIIGYGKMGRTIEKIAIERGHEIVMKISSSNLSSFTLENIKTSNAELAIEFTTPESALDNICKCFEAGIPVISGSTAWLAEWSEAMDSLEKHNGAFIYASNFSIGVNIFFALNRQLAKLMNPNKNYDVNVKEIHHTAKLDAPSGTAITLTNDIIENIDRKTKWSLTNKGADTVAVEAERVDPAPGTHIINYSSDIDEIEITHTAKSRDGFALGAVMAAEFLIDKKGLYTMRDVLGMP